MQVHTLWRLIRDTLPITALSCRFAVAVHLARCRCVRHRAVAKRIVQLGLDAVHQLWRLGVLSNALRRKPLSGGSKLAPVYVFNQGDCIAAGLVAVAVPPIFLTLTNNPPWSGKCFS